MSSEADQLKTAVFDIVVFIVTTIFAVILRGIVLSYLWVWFVVPFGIPPIGIMMALGISTIVGFLTYHDLNIKQNLHPTKTRVALSIIYPLMVFVFGYLYHIYS